ncbi:hypothetical protein G9F73_011375 [Clostridium estertheticum]|uniref:TolB family protein n=1 Tax=Clostridium estertheticum TaxID=238834 RepID=UPI0013EEB2AA|nr:hypothetical protein [Clostridium estertheticum]MBZ9608409.1 hypothetical protein [Clostridium estertheticum]
MKRIFIFTLITGLLIIGSLILIFKPYDDEYTGLDNHVSINSNDERIAFSYYKNGSASIYTTKTDGTNLIKLATAKKQYSHLSPIYSSDDSKIFYIKTPNNKKKLMSSICVMNENGKNDHKILEVDGLITEIILSTNNQKIFILKARTYKHYSPIASTAPHEYDIFSVDINGKNLKQLTFIKEYQLKNLNITKDGNTLIFNRSDEVGNNISTISLNALNNPISILSIKDYGTIEKNDTIGDIKLSPDNNSIAFSAVAKSLSPFEYELYTMDIKTRRAKQLTSLRLSANSPTYYHKSDKLLFFKYTNWPDVSPAYELYLINTDGTNMNKISIDIPLTTHD